MLKCFSMRCLHLYKWCTPSIFYDGFFCTQGHFRCRSLLSCGQGWDSHCFALCHQFMTLLRRDQQPFIFAPMYNLELTIMLCAFLWIVGGTRSTLWKPDETRGELDTDRPSLRGECANHYPCTNAMWNSLCRREVWNQISLSLNVFT